MWMIRSARDPWEEILATKVRFYETAFFHSRTFMKYSFDKRDYSLSLVILGRKPLQQKHVSM